jgi:lipopolysaccharide transport system ATP-binding protein
VQDVASELPGRRGRPKFDAIVDFAGIEEFIDTPVQNNSSGMKVRLRVAVVAQSVA